MESSAYQALLRSIPGGGRAGSSLRRLSVPDLLPQQRLPSTVSATMGSLPRARICINMQSCPCTFCTCNVTLTLFPPFLLLKIRKTCADVTRVPSASEPGVGRPKWSAQVVISSSLVGRGRFSTRCCASWAQWIRRRAGNVLAHHRKCGCSCELRSAYRGARSSLASVPFQLRTRA